LPTIRRSILRSGLSSFLFFAPALTFAQSQLANGTIVITALDSTGAVVDGVAVELRNKATGFLRSVLTNAEGQGLAPLLPLGTYEIIGRKPGFSTVQIQDLLLEVGQQRALTITLQVATTNTTVTVLGGDADVVESERVNSANRLNDRAVHNLPILARNFQTFMLLTPGTLVVSQTGGNANFSIGGQKGIFTNYSLDGSDYTSSFYGGQSGGDTSPFTISLEAVKEFVVIPNGFNAEYGRSGGGVMNVVTKSGTNSLHGSGFWYFQDHTFVADNAFKQPPSGRRSQFGGTLGGPIKKNRLFFFADSDNQRRNTPVNLVFNGQATLLAAASSSDPNRVAAANAFLSQQKQILASNNVTSELGKVDWNISEKHTLSARYNNARIIGDNGTYGYIVQQARSTSTFGKEVDAVDAFNVQLTSILSNHVINEFRFSASREDRPRQQHPQTLNQVVDGVTGGAGVSVTGIGSLGNSTSLPIDSVEWRRQVTENVTYNFGRHSVKAGVDLNLLSVYDFYRGGSPGTFTFFSFDSFVAKQPDQYSQYFGAGFATTYPKYLSAFVQDTFKPAQGLTLNYGLRWEGQTNPQNATPNADFLAGTKKIPNDMLQFSPRLGIAWDPKNNGRNVIRAFTGYIYAPTPTLIWANVLFQNGDISNGVNYLGTSPQTVPAFPSYTGPYATPFNTYPGTLPVTTGTVPGGQVNKVTANFHNPRIFRTNASYERLLMSDLTVTVTYDHYFTTGLERRLDLNLPQGTVQPVTGRIIYDRTLRPVPALGQIIQRESSATSLYNAMTVTINKRFSRHFQAQTFYTYGRNYSQDDNENNCCSNAGYDQHNFSLDWGRSNLDIRHNVVMNAVVFLPKGIELSPILRFQSGRPFDGTTGSDSPSAYILSPAALANFQQYIGQPNAVVYGGGNGDTTTTDRPIVNGKLFPRNAYEQPDYFRVDLRVAKAIKFRETKELKISVDILNLFNNTNKLTTNTTISSPSFGALNNADDPFSIQTGLRFIF
jgi:hypothetical protein